MAKTKKQRKTAKVRSKIKRIKQLQKYRHKMNIAKRMAGSLVAEIVWFSEDWTA